MSCHKFVNVLFVDAVLLVIKSLALLKQVKIKITENKEPNILHWIHRTELKVDFRDDY